MGRAPCCDKANVKKGPWSPEEDAKLKSYIEQHGTGGNWIALPQKIGLKRCGKSCRLRWLNYLRPNIKHGGFSEEEDNIICSLYISIGSRWSIIASQLPGRTDNDIKNYWNTRLKKKLLGKQKPGRHGHRASAVGHPIKLEVEGDGNGSCLGITTTTADGAYRINGWPQQPAALTYPIINDEQALMMKQPLVELNGATPPSPVPQQQLIFYDDPISLDWSSSLQESSGGGQALQCLNGFSSTIELDELLRFNPSTNLAATDCFFGIGGMENTATSKLENMNSWNEVSSLVYPNMIMKGYEGMQQCALEKQVHLGM